MDKAPDFGSGDCRFKSCHPRNEIFGVINMLNKEAIKFASQKVYKKCKRQTTNTLKSIEQFFLNVIASQQPALSVSLSWRFLKGSNNIRFSVLEDIEILAFKAYIHLSKIAKTLTLQKLPRSMTLVLKISRFLLLYCICNAVVELTML